MLLAWTFIKLLASNLGKNKPGGISTSVFGIQPVWVPVMVSPDSRLSCCNYHSSKVLMTYSRQRWRQQRSNPQRSKSKELFSSTLYQLPVEAAGEAAGEAALHVTASLLFWKSNLYWWKKLSDGSRFSAFAPPPKKNALQGISLMRCVNICNDPSSSWVNTANISTTIRHAYNPDHFRIRISL